MLSLSTRNDYNINIKERQGKEEMAVEEIINQQIGEHDKGYYYAPACSNYGAKR